MSTKTEDQVMRMWIKPAFKAVRPALKVTRLSQFLLARWKRKPKKSIR